MLWAKLLPFLLIQSTLANPTPHQILPKRYNAKFEFKRPEAFAPATDLNTTDRVVKLRRTGKISKSSKGKLLLLELQ